MTLVLDLARRLGPWVATGILVLTIALIGPAMCRKANDEVARARLGQESAKAANRNGTDAVTAVSAAAAREQRSNDLSRTNEQEIRNAQGADVLVDPAVRDAGLGGLCRRAAYRDDERCRLRRVAAQ